MIDWRSEQIGLGVTRCPPDSDDERVMTFVIAGDDIKVMDGQALLRAAVGPDATLTGEGTTTGYTLPNDWPPTAPEGFALSERKPRNKARINSGRSKRWFRR